MRSQHATVNKSILVASGYPYMRTRLLLPETAVPVYEQDDENMVFMNMIENIMIHEHHD